MAVKQESKHRHISKEMCLFKTENSGKWKNIQVLKNYAGIDPKYPQTSGSTREKDMEIQGPVPPETDSSPFRIFQYSSHRPQSVVYWHRPFVEFSMTKKNARFQYVETVPTKKRNWCYDHDLDTSAISCGKVYNTNLPRCLKLWLSIWQPCDTGLRPPFVGLGFMAYPENWKLLSWCFRGSWRPSGLWLHMRSKNIIIIFAQAHGTNVLSQAALANAFFLYKCFMAPRSNNLYSLEPKHIQHK